MPKLAVEKWEQEHRKRVSAYLEKIDRLFEDTIKKLTRLGVSYNYDPKKGELFTFSEDKAKEKEAAKILANMRESLNTIILAGIVSEWNLANQKNNSWLSQLFEKPQKEYMLPNLDALRAFQTRKMYGHTLSQRVWNYSKQFQEQMELALSVGIAEGRSAAKISRDIRSYLNGSDKLFRRLRNVFGNPVLSKSAKAYHPGQGVYRSSYQNAMRTARTEINMAYRQSDMIRWRQLYFIVGYEVKTSKTHAKWLEDEWIPKFRAGQAPEEICDALEGKYPKDFNFVGWHPNCKCYAVPILANEDNKRDFWEKPLNEVKDVPAKFKQWLKDNVDRIDKANKRGTLPYWITENKKYTQQYIDPTIAKNFDIYKKFGNGGVILIAKGIERGADYNDILTIGRKFAENGKIVQITPRLHYKDPRYNEIYGGLGRLYPHKCPDLIVDGEYYEYESYKRPFKKSKISHMISHGAEQSSRIIIDNNNGASDRYILNNIKRRLYDKTFKKNILEVWVYEKGNIRQLY